MGHRRVQGQGGPIKSGFNRHDYAGVMCAVELLPELAVLRQAWDRLRRPIWVFDQSRLRTLYANPAALELWDASSLDELLTRDFSDQSETARLRGERLLALTAGGGQAVERWTFYPNGRPVTVDTVISSLTLADGHSAMLLEGTAVEFLSDERRAVEALRHASTAISLFNAEGVAVFTNPEAWRLYGEAARLIERFEDPTRCEALMQAVAERRPWSEVCATTLDGRRRWRMIDARPAPDPATGNMGALVSEVDVTERVEAEAGRAAAEQKAAMAAERQAFISEMSHQLRTPLNAVLGFAGLLLDADLDAQAADHAVRIRDAGAELLEVVEQLIDLTSQADKPRRRKRETNAVTRKRTPDRALRVLCVDDNENNRALINAILRAQGMVCETVEDGAGALHAAARGGWDVILMDIHMPTMDGVEAARRIRGLEGSLGAVPIIAVTANTQDAQIQAYVEAGMSDVLAKPVVPAALLDRIAAWTTTTRPLQLRRRRG